MTLTLVMLDPHMGEPISPTGTRDIVGQKDFIDFYYCFNNVLHKLK